MSLPNSYLLDLSTILSKRTVSILWSEDFWGRRLGELAALWSFCSLKMHTRTFNCSSNEPSADLLGPLVRYDYPWKKRKEINSILDASNLFSGPQSKIPHFSIFAYRNVTNLQLSHQIFWIWYCEFWKDHLISIGCIPTFFENQTNLLRLVSFDG